MDVLRTATPMGSWRSFVWTVDLSGGILTGQIYLVNDTPCLALCNQLGLLNPALDDVASMIYHAEKAMLPKDGSAFSVGDRIYWSGVNGDPVTATFVSGYYWLAICVRNAAAGDSHVVADFLGDKATVGA